jgi:hypothetical protein
MLFDPELFDPPLFESGVPEGFVAPSVIFRWPPDQSSAGGTSGYEFTAPVKDPAALLRHGHDLAAWLQDGETIVGMPVVVPSPAGLTIAEIAHVDGIVSYSVSGGTNWQVYIVTVRITTIRDEVNPYRIDERSVRYAVQNR